MSVEEMLTPAQLQQMVERASGVQVEARCFAGVGLVEIRTRGKLDIAKQTTLLSFDVLETIYCAMLQAKMAARSVGPTGGAPAPVGTPVPGSKPM